jgi:dienelactone hydrolase
MVTALRRADWYTPFPDDYRWSYNVMIVLATARYGGAEMGEVDRVVKRLREHVGDDEQWFTEWSALADRVRALAERHEAAGDPIGALAHYRRASSYYFAAERFRFPKDDRSAVAYRAMVDTFRRSTELDDRVRVEHVEIPYEDTSLPAFLALAPAAPGETTPCVVFMDGFDGNKELNWFLGIEDLLHRGVSVLSIDTPGVGEAVRFRDIWLRHDYEVAGAAALDWLEARPEIDADRVGVMALSLGGYYAPRTASREPRFAACVAWGAIWDYHRIWRERIEAAFEKQLPVPGEHLAWSTGTATPLDALAAIEGFRLDGVVQDMACPFLLVHGEDDQQVPLDDAYRLFEAVGSKDKTLRVFTADEGGAQHCHMDNLSIATPEIYHWLADRLGATKGV